MSKEFRNENSLKGSEHVVDALSAYLDDALAVGERERVRAHLEGCEDCRAEWGELQATRTLLRSVPMASPPRAFTLTEEMAGIGAARRSPSLWDRLFAPRMAPGFAGGSVIAFVLLAMIMVGQFLGSTANSSVASLEAAQRPAAIAGTSAAEGSGARESDPMAKVYSSTPTTQAMAAAPVHIATEQATAMMTNSTADAAMGGAAATTGMSYAEPGLVPPPAVPTTVLPIANPTVSAGFNEARPVEVGTNTANLSTNYTEIQPSRRVEAQSEQRAQNRGINIPASTIAATLLAVLGVALAAGAVVARRRGV